MCEWTGATPSYSPPIPTAAPSSVDQVALTYLTGLVADTTVDLPAIAAALDQLL